MRRKLFFGTAVLVGAVFIMLNLFPELAVPARAEADSIIKEHEGIVLSIREKDDHIILVVRDPRGFRVRLTYYGEEDASETLGLSISYRALLGPGDPARNPHCFSYRNYLRSEGIFLGGTLKTWTLKEENPGPFMRFRILLYSLKNRFAMTLPEKDRGMICGMLFGDTGNIPEEIYEDFRNNGTAHILAVSGLHIGLLYSIYEKLTRGKTGKLRFLMLLAMLFVYGELALWRPSVIRAELMILMKALARLKELRYDSLTAMSLAAVILIIRNPYVIFGVGFQMSFLAIISINIISKVLPEKVPDTLAQTISVNLAMIFYQAYVFNYISPLAVLINIPVLYLAGIAIPLSFMDFGACCLAALGGPGSAGPALILQKILMIPSVSATEFMVKLNTILSFGGKSAVDIISPPEILVVAALMGMLFLSSEYAHILKLRGKSDRIRRIILSMMIAGAMVSIFFYEPITHDEIVFVDVGQGACTHIRCGTKDCLIDGGGSRITNLGKNTLKPYLLKNGARDCDLTLATHEDMDHIKGLEELNECFRVRNFIRGSALGDTYRMEEDVYIETLWPLEIKDGEKQENELSSVFMIHYRGVRVLVTGDLDKEGERAMVRYYRDIGESDKLRADVLNVGHHGSATSTGEEFLDAVKPRLAVIQVGRNNYGHPTEEVLNRLGQRGIKILRNDLHGAVGLNIEVRHGRGEIDKVHTMLKVKGGKYDFG